MTPEQCAKKWIEHAEYCDSGNTDRKKSRDYIKMIGKAQNKFDAFEWTEFTEYLRLNWYNTDYCHVIFK